MLNSKSVAVLDDFPAERLRFIALAVLSLGLANLFTDLIPLCLAGVIIHYLILRHIVPKGGVYVWAGILFPFLLVLPFHWTGMAVAWRFGVSYFALRLSYSAYEVGSSRVRDLGVWEYLAYAFHFPILIVGPISPLSLFRESFKRTEPVDWTESSLRVAVGLLKFTFFSKIFETFSYQTFDLVHLSMITKTELVCAAFGYSGYLYCNFSGVCDIAIGVSAWMGVEIAENFDEPWKATNIREFWTRWHITIGIYFRDVVFNPLTRSISHTFGKKSIPHATAFGAFVVFLCLGVWHGLKLHYILFASLHGAAVVINHYYRIILKHYLSSEEYLKYRESLLDESLRRRRLLYSRWVPYFVSRMTFPKWR